MKIYIWVIIGALVVLGAIFAIKNVKVLKMNPADNLPGSKISEPTTKTVTSSDGRVSFTYPSDWYIEESTGGTGQFGTIMQQWIISSYEPRAGEVEVPENSAQVIVEIQDGGSNLSIDQLVDCGMKLTCEKIGIDNEQFIKATGALNTGTQDAIVASFYDDKVLKMSGLVTNGPNQQQLLETVNNIENSIRFSKPTE